MEELSIKEKAKAYDKALERAKKWHTDGLSLHQPVKDVLEHIFPELKESEDERIRKELLAWLKSTDGQTLPMDRYNAAIAWLEKQGKQKYIDNLTPQEAMDIAVAKCFDEQKPAEWEYSFGKNTTVDNLIGIAECLEMNGDCSFNGMSGTDCGKFLRELARREAIEQKPAWSEEDEKMLSLIIARLHSHPHVEAEEYGKDYHFFKSLKDRVQPQQEWGEEDEKMINDMILHFEGRKRDLKTQFVAEMHDKRINWLKSLKGRCLPQPKQEWSETEEIMLGNILAIIKVQSKEPKENKELLCSFLKSLRPQNGYAYNPYKAVVESIAAMVEKYAPFDSNLQDFYDNVKVKCKDAKEYDSLYPQNAWKPSDEQMEILKEATNIAGGKYKSCLNSLYSDLKKLRGK